MPVLSPIKEFRGDYFFLSNFYPATVRLDGRTYASVEHAFQAAKTLDYFRRQIFRDSTTTAAGAKRLGRKLPIRPDWEVVKLDVMLQLVRQKFNRHKYIRNLLLNTGDSELIEGNWWGDTFWGVCRGKGKNWLGKLLMQVRKELGGQ